MAGSGSAQDEGLIRVIGTGALSLSVVNLVVGAGILRYPVSSLPVSDLQRSWPTLFARLLLRLSLCALPRWAVESREPGASMPM